MTDQISHSFSLITLLSTSLGWRFILNENILFWLTISYQEPFVFSVSVFCFQIFTVQLNLRPKIGLTYAISVVKWFFFFFFFFFLGGGGGGRGRGFFLSQKTFFFYFFFAGLKLLMQQHCEYFRKKWTSGTCWKSASKLPILQIST